MLKERAVVLNRVVKVGFIKKVAFEQSLKQERKLAVLISEGSAFGTHIRMANARRDQYAKKFTLQW